MIPFRTLRRFSLLALLPAALGAQTAVFIGLGVDPTDWNDTANWDTVATPSVTDSVLINANLTVSLTSFAEVDEVALGDSGTAGALTVGASGSLAITADLLIGCGCTSSSFTVESGGTGSSAAVYVNASSTFTVSGAGSTWTSEYLSTSGPSAAIDVSDSAVLDTGSLNLGNFGSATLDISSGGVVYTIDADIASYNGLLAQTSGEVTVTGLGSAWNIEGYLNIGSYFDEADYSSGTVIIADGGTVNVGDDAGGSFDGIVTIDPNGLLKIGDGALAGTLNAAEIVLTGLPSDPGVSATPATLAFNHTDDLTFDVLISGEGLVTKAGTGTTTLTAASTYTGDTVVTDGTLVLANTGTWGSEAVQVTGADSTLRVGSSSTLAATLTVTDGTVEVAGVLDIAAQSSVVTNGTLHILTGGQVKDADMIDGGITFNGTSVLKADGAGAITGGYFLFNDTATFDASVAGTMTGGSLLFTGTRTVALPDAGVITAGYIGLADHVSTTLGQANMIMGILDTEGDVISAIELELSGQAHATIAYTEAVNHSVVALSEDATASITAEGGMNDSLLIISDRAVVDLEADNALVESGVWLFFGGTLALNGHDTTIIDLLGDGGRITNNAATATTLTLDTGCGCSSFNFKGTIEDGDTGALGLIVTGDGDVHINGLQTYTGPTRVIGAALVVTGGGIQNSTITLESDGMLAGTGPVVDVLIKTGGIVSPGEWLTMPIATLTTGDITLIGDATFEFDIKNTLGTAGTDWDHLFVNGTLNLDSDTDDGVAVILTLALFSGDGAITVTTNFDPTENYSWLLIYASDGIENFDPENIVIDGTGFEGATGEWSVSLDLSGENLSLIYTAVPEPATYATLAGVGALAFVCWRRRRGERHPRA
ncbi:MAG: hypothetical protein K0R17_439 [Rariglobus sp.]|jgi:autotransporter-associated beta strand protein/T5SS/PEP-CTERM-associated repeat protein|nr:hypothetical protein [Rariglobus sp.]